MSWTFSLLDGVTFHDGTPFDAAAVQSWISRYDDIENKYLIEAFGSVEVVDASTVRL